MSEKSNRQPPVGAAPADAARDGSAPKASVVDGSASDASVVDSSAVGAETALRAAGLRVTAPRIAALDVIGATPHIEADTLVRAIRERLGSVSRQAVYDTLHTLTEHGIVRQIHLDGRAARYERQRGDNHHHMICTRCGRLEDVPCALGEAPCLVPSTDFGFDVEIAEVLYRGVCPDCRARELQETG